MRHIELLSPGGSMEGIRAAVHAGADAVYAGGRMFGARAFARNLETQELMEAIDYCHLHGAKLYLTVNTLLKEEELTLLLPEYLAPIYEHGVDAVLVQDFGVFRFLKKHFPDLSLHASTQMTVSGPDGVKLLREMGADRVVLSRELGLEEIRLIRSECDVELETFVHGALCYCYSGKCLMSSMIGGRSGNRGRCAQPCRLRYDFYDRSWDGKSRKNLNRPKEQYLLSPKDICTLRLIPDLADAGVDSLKIEGRMKSPEYAAGVTAMYRRYLDLYLKHGRDGYHVDPDDEALLAELFSRGEFSEGYYRNRNGRGMMVLREKKPQTKEALRHSQETAARFRTRYVEAEKEILLEAKVSIRAGEKARMTVRSAKGHTCTVEGFVPDRAMSRAADREMIHKQIDRTGNTGFRFTSVEILLEDGLFVPVRELNELRRSALDAMREEILRPMRRRSRETDLPAADGGKPASAGDASIETGVLDILASEGHPGITASVCTKSQLEAVLEAEKVGGVYLDYALCTRENALAVRSGGRKAYLMLPQVWRADTARIVQNRIRKSFGAFSGSLGKDLDGIVVRCFDQLYALKSAGLLNQPGFEVIADASLYTWNREARKMLLSLGVTMDTLPYECSARELKKRGAEGSEWIIYGYQTLMVSAQCLVKTTAGCRKEPGIHFLLDRKGASFPVKNDCLICTNTILNSVPLDLVSVSGQVRELSPVSVRYLFTVESPEQTRRILEGDLPDRVTRGHFRKGAD